MWQNGATRAHLHSFCTATLITGRVGREASRLQHPYDTSFAAHLAVDPYGVKAATYPPLLTYARGYGGGACPDIHGHYLQVFGNATPERGTAGWRQHRTRAESPHTGEEDGLPAQGSHTDKRTR